MTDTASERINNEARETLERLYDNPEQEISKLADFRPKDETVEQEFPVFQALANQDRLRLLEALRHGERCGCELMVILDAPQSTIATHLRKLRDAGLVKNRKKGKWNYYRVADSAVFDILDLAVSLQDG